MSKANVAARAVALLELNRPKDAVDLLSRAAGSADPELCSLLVLALFRAERTADAAATADHALAEVGPDPELARIASYVFMKLKQPVKALMLAQSAVDAKPQWLPGLLALAWAHSAAGNHREAQSVISAALTQAPDQADVYVAAGDVAAAGSSRRLARTHYRTALRLDPSRADALIGLGLLAERYSGSGQAARWYAQALAMSPGNAELAKLVRGLFGQALGVISAAAMILNIVVFVAFMAVAAPHGKPPSTVASVFWSIVAFVVCGGLLWLSLRGTPRAVLNAFRSDSTAFRQVRRAVRRTIAQLVLLGGAVLIVLTPGDVDTRIGLLTLLFFPLGAVLAVVNLIAMRIAFGYGLRRPASR
jgi:tetratricopeptide (TPR) repeat protein